MAALVATPAAEGVVSPLLYDLALREEVPDSVPDDALVLECVLHNVYSSITM